MIIQTVTRGEFHDAFRNMHREDQFSHAAKNVLFEYLDEISEDTGEPYDLDVIALCCEFWELDAKEARQEYGHLADDDAGDDELLEVLRDNTTVLNVPGDTFVICQF